MTVRERETKHITGESFKPCIAGKEGKLLAVDLLSLLFPAAFLRVYSSSLDPN